MNDKNPTPPEMLKLYRAGLNEESQDQLSQFYMMSTDERLEFLFLVALHTNQVMSEVIDVVFPAIEVPPGTTVN